MAKPHRPITAFGISRPVSPEQPVLSAEAAAVGPIEDDGSAFLLLLATEHDYVFRVSRDHLARLGKAIEQTLRDTVPDAH